MNWKTLLVVVIASGASAFGGAWLATQRTMPLAMNETAPPVQTPWVQEIVTRVNQLEQENETLKETVTTAQERMTEIETVFVASGLEMATQEIENFRASLAETDTKLSLFDERLNNTSQTVTQIEEAREREAEELTLEDFIFIDTNTINGVAGPHIIFEGVNVHIQSGSGATHAVNGVGNLFVGYNESGDGGRFGSHNLIVGPGHSYETYGAFLAGQTNTAIGPSSTVSGGSNNVAAGPASIVCGGDANTTTGEFASIVGGSENEARGNHSIIVGGQSNSTSGSLSTIAGGRDNSASAALTGVFAGAGNDARATLAAIACSLDAVVSKERFCTVATIKDSPMQQN